MQITRFKHILSRNKLTWNTRELSPVQYRVQQLVRLNDHVDWDYWNVTGTTECFQFMFMYIDRDTGEFAMRSSRAKITEKTTLYNILLYTILLGATRVCLILSAHKSDYKLCVYYDVCLHSNELCIASIEVFD